MRDILATLVDLANRGYIRFEEQKESGFLHDRTAFKFIRLRQSTAGLRPYEQTLLDKVFGSKDERDLDDLKQKFYSSIGGLQKQLYEESVKVGYFPENPNTTRYRYGCIGVALMIIVGVGGFVGIAAVGTLAPVAGLLWVAAGIIAIGFFSLSFFMSRKTPAGATAALKWRGFKRYLEDIDKYTDVAAAKDQFAKYLPYAIAFGLERSWVERLLEGRHARATMVLPLWRIWPV